MEISKMLTISTVHITKETNDLLESEADKNITIGFPEVYGKENYGYFIHVPEDLEEYEEVPRDLLKCMLLAQKNDCEWLCLDCDGEVVDELETYCY